MLLRQPLHQRNARSRGIPKSSTLLDQGSCDQGWLQTRRWVCGEGARPPLPVRSCACQCGAHLLSIPALERQASGFRLIAPCLWKRAKRSWDTPHLYRHAAHCSLSRSAWVEHAARVLRTYTHNSVAHPVLPTTSLCALHSSDDRAPSDVAALFIPEQRGEHRVARRPSAAPRR